MYNNKEAQLCTCCITNKNEKLKKAIKKAQKRKISRRLKMNNIKKKNSSNYK